MRFFPALSAALLLAACASTPAPQASPPPPPRPAEQAQVPPSRPVITASSNVPAPRILEGPGLSGIIREEAGPILLRFGQPRLDVLEGDMRKLQFAGDACVLDIFLYPLQPGGTPVATWVEARRASDGAAVDRLACIQALSR